MSQGWKAYLDPAAVRFVLVFGALVVGLSLIIQIPWVDRNLVGPYTEFLAWIAGGILDLLGTASRVSGTIIRSGGFAVDIRRGCDGVVATILLVSACLAFPFSWRDRALGTLLGYLLIFLLNMIRIVGLFLIGLSGSDSLFDFFHTYVSQFAVIALTMVFWLFWAGRHQPAPSR